MAIRGFDWLWLKMYGEMAGWYPGHGVIDGPCSLATHGVG